MDRVRLGRARRPPVERNGRPGIELGATGEEIRRPVELVVDLRPAAEALEGARERRELGLDGGERRVVGWSVLRHYLYRTPI